MPDRAVGIRVHGRAAERTAIDELRRQARDGRGGALLILGSPGLGRTTLLEHGARCIPAATVLRTCAVAAESSLRHSGLHALLRPVADRLHAVGDSRTRPLLAAMDLVDQDVDPVDHEASAVVPVVAAVDAPARRPRSARSAPSPGLMAQSVPTPRESPETDAGRVGRALLHALAGLAAEGGLLCCVDDADQLDPASRAALSFAVRRLTPAHGVTVLLTARQDARRWPPEIPVRRLRPLTESDAAAMLDDLVAGPLRPTVRELLLHSGRGVPRLLTELVAGLAPGQLAGLVPLPRHLLPAASLSWLVRTRLDGLPGDTRLLLLLAAVELEIEGVVDVGVLLRAAERAGLHPSCLEPAEAAGLVRVDGPGLGFADRLLPEAVYRGESQARRRSAHGLLAAVADDPERSLRALRHRAACAVGPDAALADAIEAAVDRVGSDGDACTAAASACSDALSRAAELTGDRDRRGARLIRAAEHAWAAGRTDQVRSLLARSGASTRSATLRGRTEYLRGIVELRDGIVEDAREALLLAAALLSESAPGLAAEALAKTAEACWTAGDRRGLATVTGAVAALRADAPTPPRRVDDAAGLLPVLRGDHRAATATVRELRRRAAGEAAPEVLLDIATSAAILGASALARQAGSRAVARARAGGRTAIVPRALELLVYAELRLGEHARAAEHAVAGLAAARTAGQGNCALHLRAALAMSAAVAGDAVACREHAAAVIATGRARGLSLAVSLAEWSLARLDLSLSRPKEAADRLFPLVQGRSGHSHFAVRFLAVPCLVEASVLARDPRPVGGLLRRFEQRVRAVGDTVALAQALRCRALLDADPAEADALFGAALRLHEAVGTEFECARTRRLHGEFLRRRRRPREAREQLRGALRHFESCGARIWADRVRDELRATGAATGGRGGLLGRLTPQQLRISRQVAAGATNREVASTLCLSPRTIDHHLRNVFAALGVRSRVELVHVLAAETGDDVVEVPARQEPPGAAGVRRRRPPGGTTPQETTPHAPRGPAVSGSGRPGAGLR
ncbi:helix-turn-helix transcriptional regulator [Actinoalloteichus fjordicus]|uniref:Transcriptional regulator, luxR family n=1 Tax=Actinoalloteichus fjordicus TaxID=1612552 RepID=A0AAC9PRU2_9PSEU|nr:helix-turn-helix transcriptional regulator [Actinoalloteichus fjordicus]APU14764.1 transcriptional regulator, luxR family [Actinoalloteichus fjordicus]